MEAVDLPHGWLTPLEADELRRIARGRTVLELGAWKGRSTAVFSQSASYVVSVDKHEGIPEVGGEDSLPDYLASVRMMKNVAIVVADWTQLHPMLGTFDVVYVDGNHDLESVKRDTLIAMDHAEETIAFHDWDFEEVRQGAAAALGHTVPANLVGSVATFHREDWL